jgi:hypothetical protein
LLYSFKTVTNLYMKGIKFTPESISKIGAYCTSYADFKKCGVFLK